MKSKFLTLLLVGVVAIFVASSCASSKHGCPSPDAKGRFKG